MAVNGYCQIPDCNKPSDGRTGLCASHNRAMRKEAKPQIRKIGEKLMKKLTSYDEAKRQFVHGKRCAVFPVLKATEVHHMAGRTNDMLMDKKYWLPVSRKCHVEIEMNPAWAKKMGYSVSRLTTNK